MAAEAVLKVREAEEKGSELLRKAGEEAKEIIKKAEIDGNQKRKEIVALAHRMKSDIIEAAVKKAGGECSALEKQSAEEREKILNPGKAKLDNAVKLVIERIVNTHGNS